MTPTTRVIQIDNLTHNYGSFTAVKDVSMEVCQGEIFGFLGPNGAGKTTTIRTMLDFIRPTKGQIAILGMDARQESAKIRHRIGYLPSELKLWENWTGVQYIRWLETVHQKPLLAYAQELSERLNYDLERSLRGMSTGMKRKMGLIAALAHRPELLILDEPTNGLDPLMQRVFHELMLEAKNEGRTVFLSSHILTEVEQICDRVGIIRKGELQAVQTVESLTEVTFRWITVKTPEITSVNGFSSINGVSDVSLNNGKIRMKVSGDANMDAIIKQAAQYRIDDLNIVHPTLEEIFLAFYDEQER